MKRTLEQILKFDCGLHIGQNLVKFTLDAQERKAIVDIGKRGRVMLLLKPEPGDMYSSWSLLKGDKTLMDSKCGVIVWAARMPDLMSRFEGEPSAHVRLYRGGVDHAQTQH